MKEEKVNLTRQGQEAYSKSKPKLNRGGDIFMETEGGQNINPANSQPKGTAGTEKVIQVSKLDMEKPVSAEQQAMARKAWDEFDKGRVLSVDERGVRERIIERGFPPIAGGAQEPNEQQTPPTGGAAGAPPGGGEPPAPPSPEEPRRANFIDTATFTDQNAINLANQINLLEGNFLNERILEDFYKEALRLPASSDRQALFNSLQAMRRALEEEERRRMMTSEERRFGFYLQPGDLLELRRDAVAWLDGQFDVLYRFAQEGQELTSPIVNNMQTVVSEAVRYLQTYNPDILEEFQRLFTIRFNLMQNRTAIGYRSIDNIKQAAHTLQIHGLLYALSFEKSKVGAMFNRMHEMLEDERLRSVNFHVTPQSAYQLQDKLIHEQISLADKGVGLFAELPKETEENKEARERAIRRAVRTAYDVFVSSQRMGVLVARGRRLEGNEAYFSDPASGPLNVYNIEDLLYEKFDIYNRHDQEFVERIKLEIADDHLKKQEEKKKKAIDAAKTSEEKKAIEEKWKSAQKLTEEERLDLGKRLMRDLFAVPDFFSSGWRIEGVLDALNGRFGKDNTKNLALFLRLKLNPNKDTVGIGKEEYDRMVNDVAEEMAVEDKATSKEKHMEKVKKDPEAYRRYIWEKIRIYRPEEIIRLFRERADGELASLYDKMIAIDEKLALTDDEKKANKPIKDGGQGKSITVYDKFKTRYGSILRVLREGEFQKKTPEQVNMANLSNEQVNIINQALGEGEGENVKSMFSAMQSYIGERRLIDPLLTDTRFADIYTRTILLDDAILDRLEIAENDSAPLSKMYAVDQGGDALVRSWNDHENAIKAAQGLIGFIKSENPEKRIESALNFAEAASQYNGQGQRAQAVRFTVGTFLNISKKDYFWDTVGIETGLFRTSVADIQRIYGPQAKSMGRDELRHHLDETHLVLVSAIDKKFINMSEEEKEHNPDYLKEIQNTEKFYHDLEELLEVRGKDKAKLVASRFFLFLLLALFGETYKLGKEAVGSKTSS